MKAILKFDLDNLDDKKAHNRCIKSTQAYIVLHDISQQIFRAARKHGYIDKNLSDIVEYARREGYEINGENIVLEMVSVLEDKFYELLENHNVNLDDLE